MGIIAKRAFQNKSALMVPTFYGIAADGERYLNGDSSKNSISNGVKSLFFKLFTDTEIDIYVDPGADKLKMCVVGVYHEDKEVIINGINESGNKDGWVPCISFGYTSRNRSSSMRVRICSIDVGCYGKAMEIDWD